MSIAHIVLEDDNGAVACKLVFAGGYNRSSGAHQAAQILIGQMDTLMERRGAAVIDPLVVEADSRRGIEPTQGEQVVAALMGLKAKADAQG